MRATKPPRHSVDISEEAGVRYLHFGSDWVQGAMRIARPWSLELGYTREMMAGLLLRDGAHWPRNALLIGLGAGSLAKFIYRNLPDCRMTGPARATPCRFTRRAAPASRMLDYWPSTCWDITAGSRRASSG